MRKMLIPPHSTTSPVGGRPLNSFLKRGSEQLVLTTLIYVGKVVTTLSRWEVNRRLGCSKAQVGAGVEAVAGQRRKAGDVGTVPALGESEGLAGGALDASSCPVS